MGDLLAWATNVPAVLMLARASSLLQNDEVSAWAAPDITRGANRHEDPLHSANAR